MVNQCGKAQYCCLRDVWAIGTYGKEQIRLSYNDQNKPILLTDPVPIEPRIQSLVHGSAQQCETVEILAAEWQSLA